MGGGAVGPLRRNGKRSEKGFQSIELAMLLPAVLMSVLLFGEVSRVMFYKIAIQSAVREGARIAALHGSQSEVEAVIRRSVGKLTLEQIEISRTANRGFNGDQQSVEGIHTGDVAVKVVAVVPLETFSSLGLPHQISRVRLEERTVVPVLH